MRDKIVKWTALIFLLTYTAIAAVWANTRSYAEKCRGLDIEITGGGPGAQFITPAGVRHELGSIASNPGALRAREINTKAIEEMLSANNNFEHVECWMTTDNRLRIDIVPMIPEIRIFSRSESYYINKDGKRIDARPEFFVNVPIVSGDFTQDFPASSILPVTRAIASDSLMKDLITMVDVKSPTNIYLVPRIHGHVINIGDTSRLADKFRDIRTMYRHVIPYRGWEMYDTISVKFAGQIVAVRRDKSATRHSSAIDDGTDMIEEASLEGQQLRITGRETDTSVATAPANGGAEKPSKAKPDQKQTNNRQNTTQHKQKPHRPQKQ